MGQAGPITGYCVAVVNDRKFAETIRNPAWPGRQHFASVSVGPATLDTPCVLLTLSSSSPDRSKALSYVPKKYRVIDSFHGYHDGSPKLFHLNTLYLKSFRLIP